MEVAGAYVHLGGHVRDTDGLIKSLADKVIDPGQI
jgi:hypothetical protein